MPAVTSRLGINVQRHRGASLRRSACGATKRKPGGPRESKKSNTEAKAAAKAAAKGAAAPKKVPKGKQWRKGKLLRNHLVKAGKVKKAVPACGEKPRKHLKAFVDIPAIKSHAVADSKFRDGYKALATTSV